MYRILATILFLSLSFQSMVKLGIMAWYQVNKTYVATVLCENKDKPEMRCCGKCYVNKQMQKVDQNSGSEKQMPGKNTRTETVEYIIPTQHTKNLLLFLQDVKVYNGHYTASNGFEVVSSIFHPPPFIG